MSGHSKWSTIKRQKGVADAKRSQTFTKLSNTITVAARQGSDPEMNFKLRLAIDRARAASMPKDNIERAIKRGTGNEDGTKLEEIQYEAYGPGGVAFLIETLTDNHNRTTGNIRHVLERHGGRLAESGSVGWLFEPKAIIQTTVQENRDELELLLIEAGATDIKEEVGDLIIYSEPINLENVKKVLVDKNLPLSYAAVEPVAKTSVKVEDKNVENKLNEIREALDEDDDVNNIYDNEA